MCRLSTIRNSILIFVIIGGITSSVAFPKDFGKPTKGPPIILIPGDGGNQVEARLNKSSTVHYICNKKTPEYFNIWLNMELLVPLVIDCWVDNMRLVYDNVTRRTYNSPGVDIRIPGFGNTSVVEWLDPSQASEGSYFKDIVDGIVSVGHVRDETVRGAPYDFRKAANENAEYFEKLAALIEETYAQNEGRKVLLIAHSMGAPMTLYFLNHRKQAWKDKYIRALVTLAGAWGGSAKALKVYTEGDNLGVYVLSQSALRDEQRTSPSLAWMMPSSRLWGATEVLVETENRNYTVKDFKDFFYDIGYMHGWEMFKDTRYLTADLTPPGVELHCLHGNGIPTTKSLKYAPGKFPGGSPELIMGDGDGTVNRRSLEACQGWSGKQKHKVYRQSFPGVDHMAILHDPHVIAYIKDLIHKL